MKCFLYFNVYGGLYNLVFIFLMLVLNILYEREKKIFMGKLGGM